MLFKIEKIIKEAFKFLLFVFFTLSIKSNAQNTVKNKNYVLSVLVAGACQNVLMYDDDLDSICKSKGFAHYYYLIGIESSELKDYSFKIFGKQFYSEQVISKEDFESLGIGAIKDVSLIHFINNGKLKSSKNYYDIQVADFNFLNFGENELVLPNLKPIEGAHKDSINLTFFKKLKVDSKIRFNSSTQMAKSAKELFILDPLFNRKLYKLSIDSGEIIDQIDLNKSILNYDSLLIYFYKNNNSYNPNLVQPLINYYSRGGPSTEMNFYSIAIEDSFLYLSGDIVVVGFDKNHRIDGLSHRIIIKFDLDLNFLGFFFDKYLSYGNYFVDFSFLDCFKSNRFQCKLMNMQNQRASVIRTIYFKLDSKQHQMVKYDKDSLVLPLGFPSVFYTNYTSHIQNVGNQTPIWLMDPYPYFYFPQDTALYNFITDKNVASDLKQDSIEYDEEDEYTKNTILSMKKIDNFLMLNYVYEGMTYSIKYDLIEKKRIYKKELGRLPAFNLNTSFDEAGKLYYFPINNSSEDNYLYFE